MAWATPASGTPLSTAYILRCSLTVRSGYRISCCGHTPKEFLMLDMSAITSRPATKALPDVAGVIPVNMAIAVVCAPMNGKRG